MLDNVNFDALRMYFHQIFRTKYSIYCCQDRLEQRDEFVGLRSQLGDITRPDKPHQPGDVSYYAFKH